MLLVCKYKVLCLSKNEDRFGYQVLIIQEWAIIFSQSLSISGSIYLVKSTKVKCRQMNLC